VQVEEKRKEDYLTKQEYHEHLRAKAVEERNVEQELYHQQQILLEKKRQLVLRQFKDEEEASSTF
jgi:hypothetical protein